MNTNQISIKAYQDGAFYYINKFLRDNISDDNFMLKYNLLPEKLIEIKNHIYNIDNEFLNIRKDTELNNYIVYRGIHNTINGNIIYSGKDNGFVSTSKSLKIAQKFAGKQGVIYEIILNKDISFIDITINNPYEQEILLQRSLTYTIISQKKIKQNIYVTMKVNN